MCSCFALLTPLPSIVYNSDGSLISQVGILMNALRLILKSLILADCFNFLIVHVIFPWLQEPEPYRSGVNKQHIFFTLLPVLPTQKQLKI